MKSLVGYQVNRPEGPAGEPGLFYTYVMARNGLWVRAENEEIELCLQLAQAEVRGLTPLERVVRFKHGLFSVRVLMDVVALFRSSLPNERYAHVWRDGDQWVIAAPEQEASPAVVRYERPQSAPLGIHSHGFMNAFFSSADDQDDAQGVHLEIVVGDLDRFIPSFRARVCLYGHFEELCLQEIFDMHPTSETEG